MQQELTNYCWNPKSRQTLPSWALHCTDSTKGMILLPLFSIHSFQLQHRASYQHFIPSSSLQTTWSHCLHMPMTFWAALNAIKQTRLGADVILRCHFDRRTCHIIVHLPIVSCKAFSSSGTKTKVTCSNEEGSTAHRSDCKSVGLQESPR